MNSHLVFPQLQNQWYMTINNDLVAIFVSQAKKKKKKKKKERKKKKKKKKKKKEKK